LGLDADSWEAFQLDMATLTVGRWIDSKLAERDKQGKPIHRLQTLLRDDVQPDAEYRSLKGAGVRKMAVPESGIW
jgi:hypothetical protein